MPTALPPHATQFAAPLSPAATQPQASTQFTNNLFGALSAAPPRTQYTSPPAAPMQNVMRPMVASPPPMSGTPPVMMGAPLIPNSAVKTPLATTPGASLGTPSQQKPSASFDDLWSMSLGSASSGKGPAAPQKSMKALEEEKAHAQMWGAGQNRPPAGAGFGSFSGAPASSTTNATPSASSSGNGLDDLLF